MIILLDVIILIFVIISIMAAISFYLSEDYSSMASPIIFCFILTFLFIASHIGEVPSEEMEIRPKELREYVGDVINVNGVQRQIVNYKQIKNCLVLDNGVMVDFEYVRIVSTENLISAPKMKTKWVWFEKGE